MKINVLKIFGTVSHFYLCSSYMKQLQINVYPKSHLVIHSRNDMLKDKTAALVTSSPTNECIMHLHMLCRVCFRITVKKASDCIKMTDVGMNVFSCTCL